MKKKTYISWSSGKDSAWSLYQLLQDSEYDIAGMFCTINEKYERVAMHAVRQQLLVLQAKQCGLPLYPIYIPDPCSNEDYEKRMQTFIDFARKEKVECFAFGDLYLEDIRAYREDKLANTGITPVFPLWNKPTHQLSRDMISQGLKAKITCIDPKIIPEHLSGRDYDYTFLDELPESVDPCGENGEFHSFVYDGPMFSESLDIKTGEIVKRDGFIFADIKLNTQ